MTDRQQTPSTAPGPLSLTASLLWLSLVLAGTFLLVGGYTYSQQDAEGLRATTVAWLVCWGAGSLALMVVRLMRTPERAISGMLLANLIRMGLPLATGVVLQYQGGPLAEAGVFGRIVIFYLVMLVTEAYLSVRLVKQATEKTKAS